VVDGYHSAHVQSPDPTVVTPIILLIAHLDIRIIAAATGELYRHLTLDPNRRYHGTG
jgi:hypothetical protein